MADKPSAAHPFVTSHCDRCIGEEVPAPASADHLPAEFRVVSERKTDHSCSVSVVGHEWISFGHRQFGIEPESELAKGFDSRSPLLELGEHCFFPDAASTWLTW